LKSLRTVIFLAELNGLKTWATAIGNTYLEAETSEKVFIIAGPEFGELEGLSFIWDGISSMTKKAFHVSHLASTSISSLRHMSACLGQSQRQTRSRLHW
jgi:predicted solute-binding protein